MPERPALAHVAVQPAAEPADPPPPEVAEFIRFCHRRRAAVWPELYDVMCAVAARREFRGWGPEQLADRGVTLALPGMPRLARWVRATVGAQRESADVVAVASSGV